MPATASIATTAAYAEIQGTDSIVEMFERAVALNPHALALQLKTQSMTYADFNAEVNQVARLLIQLGVAVDGVVGLSLPRSIEQIVCVFAILKAGGAYLPLDPSYPQERLDYMVADSGIELVITAPDAGVDFGGKVRKVLHVGEMMSAAAGLSSQNSAVPVQGRDLAYLMYTSGSTGQPKGVMIEHRSLAGFTRTARRLYHIASGDRVLQFASLSFDASVEEIFPCLAAGANLVLRTDGMLAPLARFVHYCRMWGITVLDLPTAYWHIWVDEISELPLPSALRLVIIGGEAACPHRLAAWQQAVGSRVRLLNTYGPTETTVAATWADLTHESSREAPPIGHPLEGNDLWILDETGRPVTKGEAGELYVGGQQVARGYFNRPDLTEERFIVLPFGAPDCLPLHTTPTPLEAGTNASTRLYRTGDQVKQRADGQLVFLGRRDRQVKIRGFRIELDEIESVLARHPHVKLALVNTFEDRLAAYLVAQKEASGDLIHSVQDWARRHLPAYMVPDGFSIIGEPLPLTPGGKVDYDALPPPRFSSYSTKGHIETPRDTIETRLHAIWREVLGTEAIGRHCGFFELGGNSLMAVKLLGQIELAFGRTIALKDLPRAGTIAAMASVLKLKHDQLPPEPVVAIQPEGSYPPLFFVCPTSLVSTMALSARLGDRQPLYGLNISHLHQFQHLDTLASPRIIAGWLMEEMQKVHPQGPYILGGICLGAKMAYEMALQFLDRGEPVAMLFLLDAVWRYQPRYSRLRRHWTTLRTFGPTYMPRLLKERFNNYGAGPGTGVLATYYAKHHKINATLQQQQRGDASFLDRLEDTFKDYQPRPYPAPMMAFFNREWRIRYAWEPDWLAAAGDATIQTIHGFHDDFFRSPQIEEVAKHMRRAIDGISPVGAAPRKGSQ